MKKGIEYVHLSPRIRRRWFAVLAICICLTPHIYIGHLPAFRLEQVVIFLAALGVIWARLGGERVAVPWSLFPKMLAGFSVLMLIAIANGYLGGWPVIINDFYEILKMGIAVGIFLLTAGTIAGREDQHWALGLLHGLIVVSALVSFAQFFNVGGLNQYYIPYIAPTQYVALMEGYTWPRVVGLTGNPNRYSYMAALGALLGVVLMVRRRNPLYLVSGMLCLTAMLMTRSRTGFLFFGVLLLVWIIAEYRVRMRNGFMVLLVAAGVGAVLYGLLYLFPHYLTWRLKELFHLAESRSWQIRLGVWSEYFWVFMDHPLLGSGPTKARPFRLPPDNEWLLLLKRYGLVGTAYLITAFGLPVQQHLTALLQEPAGPVYLALLVGSAVFMIPSGIFHSFQGMALLMVCAGLALGSRRSA